MRAVDSGHPGVQPVQQNYRALCKRTEVAPVQRKALPPGFTTAPGTADAARLAPAAFQMTLHDNSPPRALMFACSLSVSPRPHGQRDASPCRRATSPLVVREQSLDDSICTGGQQKMTSRVSRCSSKVSTAASTVCSPRVVVRDLRMDLVGTCNGSSQRVTDPVSRCSLVSRCSSQASTEDPDAVNPRTDSLRLHNQFLELQLHKATRQLQHQQKVVQLLMKQLGKEQETRHRLEDALFERC